MAIDNLLARVAAILGKKKATDFLSQYDPPSRGDILHDGLVGVGKTWGGILGTAGGIVGGEAVGGPVGAGVGMLTLGPAGNLAGGWAAHGAYLGGLLTNDILAHPENWTVDAAGANVPAMQGPAIPSDPRWPTMVGSPISQARGPATSNAFVRESAAAAGVPGHNNVFKYGFPDPNAIRPSVFDSGAPSIRHFAAPQESAGGIPGMIADAAGMDPPNPMQPVPPAGGLLGLLQEYMRNNPSGAAR